MSADIRTVLVDEDEGYLQFVSDQLSEFNGRIQTHLATESDEVIDLVKDNQVDCVVISYEGDEEDGVNCAFDLNDSILGVESDVCTILHPSPNQVHIVNEAFSRGFDSIVAKGPGIDPIEILEDEIVSCVDSAQTGVSDLYERFVESLGDPMYMFDDEGYIKSANSAMVDMLGCDCTDDVIGMHATDFLRQEDFEEGTENIKEILRNPELESITYDVVVSPCSHTELVGEISVSPLIDTNGEFSGTVGTIRDVGDKQEYIQNLNSLHDITRGLLNCESFEKVVDQAVVSVEELFGVELAAFFVLDGNDDNDALVPTAESEASQDLLGGSPVLGKDSLAWSVYESGEAKYSPNLHDETDIHNQNTLLRSELLLPVGDFGVLIVGSQETDALDEMDRELANVFAANLEEALVSIHREEQLKEREQKLKRENERLDEFASVISHDLRNPINVIRGRVNITVEKYEDTENLDHVLSAIDRMSSIIDETLTLARQGKTVGETTLVSLSDVAAESCDNVAIDRDRVSVEPAHSEFYADPSKLFHIFENLYRNSLEHGGDDVTISVGPVDGGFYVEDDGDGVPDEKKGEIFDVGVTTDRDGTGIGLAIVSRIIEAHDWDVAVTDSDEGGARFEITNVEFKEVRSDEDEVSVVWPPQPS